MSPGTSWQRAVAVGTAASAVLGGRAPWLQWAPAALLSVLVVVLWTRFSSRFDWRQNLPLVLVLGLIAAPYLLVHELTPTRTACRRIHRYQPGTYGNVANGRSNGRDQGGYRTMESPPSMSPTER